MEKVIKKSEASYFKSASSVLNGYLTMTNRRILFSGKQARVESNYGAMGEMIGNAMGITAPQEELIFDIPISEVQHGLKRFGLSKRLVLNDRAGNEYKLMISSKSERNEWPGEIENARTINMIVNAL